MQNPPYETYSQIKYYGRVVTASNCFDGQEFEVGSVGLGVRVASQFDKGFVGALGPVAASDLSYGEQRAPIVSNTVEGAGRQEARMATPHARLPAHPGLID